jgi:hypothetical protein
MSKFLKFHKPGQGVGYKPPMNQEIFNWLAFNTGCIIVLAVVMAYTLSRLA